MTNTLDLAAGLTQLLVEATDNAEPITYLYGNARLAQQTIANTHYFLTDALGSVRQLADASGEVTLLRRYEPYGRQLSSVGPGHHTLRLHRRVQGPGRPALPGRPLLLAFSTASGRVRSPASHGAYDIPRHPDAARPDCRDAWMSCISSFWQATLTSPCQVPAKSSLGWPVRNDMRPPVSFAMPSNVFANVTSGRNVSF